MLVAGAGCSRSGEAKITGSSSAAPVSLQCYWQAGNTYRVRLEMTQIIDLERPEPNESSQHLVAYEQESLIRVTDGNRSGTLNLDMEIVALGMERANAGKKALAFDSEQGGETIDELGFIPVLKKLVGGHLRFQVSSNGNVLRADGISEWLDRALRTTNAVALAVTAPAEELTVTDTGAVPTGIPPPGNPPPGASGVNPPANVRVIRQKGRTTTTTTGGVTTTGGKVGSTLRSFFTQDQFKQMLEFPFLPPGPVRVGETWVAHGDTSVSTRGRYPYDASCKFDGWQMHSGTNCARISVEGNVNGGGAGPDLKTSKKPKTLHANMWINTELQFPVKLIIEKQLGISADTTTRMNGTNRVVTPQPGRVVQQRVATTLLWAAPTSTAAAAADTQAN
jgi:hypothetical protein